MYCSHIIIVMKGPPSTHTHSLFSCVLRIQTGVFCIYVVIMTFALIAGGEAEDPTKYNHGIDVFRGICEILSLLFCTYGLAAEVNQLRK